MTQIADPWVWKGYAEGEHPSAIGWYATIHCWEVEEGQSFQSTFWDGAHWSDDLPIGAWSATTFPTAQAAEDWAYKHAFD